MIRSYDRPVRFRAISSVLAAGLVLGAGALAGCGHTRQVGDARSVRIALTEYRVNPQDVSVSTGTLTILIHNYGRLTHNLVVSESGTSIASTHGIPPGGEAELDLSLAPGTYTMTSTILSDEALGQYGTITVH
jgi:plastocyanin